MVTTAAVTETERLTESVRRHRDGLAAAIQRVMRRAGNLSAPERRTLLKTVSASRQQLETLEQAIASSGESPTLTN